MSDPIDDPLTMHEHKPAATAEPDRLLLIGLDGSRIVVESKYRVGPIVRLRHEAAGRPPITRIYEFRGVDQVGGQWLRIHREVEVADIEIPSPR